MSNERNDGKKKGTRSEFSLIQWTSIIIVSLFLLVSPFYSALFNGYLVGYENRLYGGMMAVFVALAFLAVRFFMKWEINNYKTVLSVGALLIPVVYFISSFDAASVHFAKVSVLLYFTIAAFFIFGLYLINNDATKKWFVALIQYSGYMIVLYGVLNLFGQVYYPDALWLADGVTYRLTSVFQYSNTYAGYLIAIMLAGLYLVVHSKRWYSGTVHALMLVPIFTSFMLTYSRGALVIVPILVLIIMPFFNLVRQISFLLYMLFTVLSTFAILGTLTTNYDKIARIVQPQGGGDQADPIPFWDHLALQSWLLLIGASILTAALILVCNKWLVPWLEKKLAKISEKKWSLFALPALIVGGGLLISVLVISSGEIQKLLPQQIASRLENINFEQHSVLERQTFYRDAIKVVGDYPFFGTGGGGWAAIYQQYQSNPYTSRQAHSYFLQTLVEVGVVGFLILLAFLVLAYYLFIKLFIKHRNLRGDHFIFFIISVAIFAHSLIDFDMSYLYLSALVFFCLGAMLAPYSKELVISGWTEFNKSKIKLIFPASLAILSIVLFSWTLREYNANNYYDQAMRHAVIDKLPLNQLLPDLDKAISIAPDHPTYTLTKVNWLTQAFQQTKDQNFLQQAKASIEQLRPYEPYNRDLILAEYRNFKDLGAYKDAVNSLDEGIRKFPWDINFYEAAIMEYFISGQSTMSTNQDSTNKDWDHSLKLYQNVLSRMELLKDLPKGQLQGRPFELTPLIRQAIGGIYYFKKDYQLSIDILKPVITGDLKDDTIRTSVKYYLASLHKLGQDDKNLQNTLINFDPNEKIALEELEKSS